MTYSKTAIDKAVQAFQILYGVTITAWHCEKLLCLVGQAHEAEEAQHTQSAPAVAPPPTAYDECCGTPNTCEQPCFHRPAKPEPDGDGWGPWIDWHGGDCPVNGDAVVQWDMGHAAIYGPRTASELRWSHVGLADIKGYRVKL